MSNDIFEFASERKYKREIQSFIESLTKSTDRTKGIWYLTKDGKRVFRINTSIENYAENRNETSYGFEVADWYRVENLSKEQLEEIKNGINNRENINSLLSSIESERGAANSDNIIVGNKKTTTDNVGLDSETLSG